MVITKKIKITKTGLKVEALTFYYYYSWSDIKQIEEKEDHDYKYLLIYSHVMPHLLYLEISTHHKKAFREKILKYELNSFELRKEDYKNIIKLLEENTKKKIKRIKELRLTTPLSSSPLNPKP